MKKNILTIIFFVLSFTLLVIGKEEFNFYLTIISLFSFYEIMKLYNINRSVPLYIEVLNYLALILATALVNNAFDYRLIALLLFINFIPLLFHKKEYEIKDAFFLLGANVLISSAASSLTLIRNESLYEAFYILIIVFICKIFYFLGDYYIGKNYNRFGKSYEGIVCSILMGSFVSSVFYLVFINSFNSDFFIVIVSFILGIVCISGELMINYVNNMFSSNKLSNKNSINSGSIFSRVTSIFFVTLAYMIIKSIL